jgi:hypothetical protein
MVVPGDKQRGLTERPRRGEETMSMHPSSRDVEQLYPQWRDVLEKGHIIAAIRNIEALAAAAKSPTQTVYLLFGNPLNIPDLLRTVREQGKLPLEKLLRAQLIQMLYSVRSERLLMEEIDYSMLFRWFVGMNLDEPVWDATVFTKNRDRLLEGDVAREFLGAVVAQAQAKGLTSHEHFTVDGTLIEAWASLKSFQRKDKSNVGPCP